MLEVWEIRSSGEKSLTGFEQKKTVYFIQEMHCTETIRMIGYRMGLYEALFSCCTSEKAGVAIHVAFQISKTYSDPETFYNM